MGFRNFQWRPAVAAEVAKSPGPGGLTGHWWFPKTQSDTIFSTEIATGGGPEDRCVRIFSTKLTKPIQVVFSNLELWFYLWYPLVQFSWVYPAAECWWPTPTHPGGAPNLGPQSLGDWSFDGWKHQKCHLWRGSHGSSHYLAPWQWEEYGKNIGPFYKG